MRQSIIAWALLVASAELVAQRTTKAPRGGQNHDQHINYPASQLRGTGFFLINQKNNEQLWAYIDRAGGSNRDSIENNMAWLAHCGFNSLRGWSSYASHLYHHVTRGGNPTFAAQVAKFLQLADTYELGVNLCLFNPVGASPILGITPGCDTNIANQGAAPLASAPTLVVRLKVLPDGGTALDCWDYFVSPPEDPATAGIVRDPHSLFQSTAFRQNAAGLQHFRGYVDSLLSGINHEKGLWGVQLYNEPFSMLIAPHAAAGDERRPIVLGHPRHTQADFMLNDMLVQLSSRSGLTFSFRQIMCDEVGCRALTLNAINDVGILTVNDATSNVNRLGLQAWSAFPSDMGFNKTDAGPMLLPGGKVISPRELDTIQDRWRRAPVTPTPPFAFASGYSDSVIPAVATSTTGTVALAVWADNWDPNPSNAYGLAARSDPNERSLFVQAARLTPSLAWQGSAAVIDQSPGPLIFNADRPAVCPTSARGATTCSLPAICAADPEWKDASGTPLAPHPEIENNGDGNPVPACCAEPYLREIINRQKVKHPEVVMEPRVVYQKLDGTTNKHIFYATWSRPTHQGEFGSTEKYYPDEQVEPLGSYFNVFKYRTTRAKYEVLVARIEVDATSYAVTTPVAIERIDTTADNPTPTKRRALRRSGHISSPVPRATCCWSTTSRRTASSSSPTGAADPRPAGKPNHASTSTRGRCTPGSAGPVTALGDPRGASRRAIQAPTSGRVGSTIPRSSTTPTHRARHPTAPAAAAPRRTRHSARASCGSSSTSRPSIQPARSGAMDRTSRRGSCSRSCSPASSAISTSRSATTRA